MTIAVIIGSRADEGLLAWPVAKLEQAGFDVWQISLKGETAWDAMRLTAESFERWRPDWMLCLGDRFEVLGAALAAHLWRVPIAHLCGGDVTEGSYDDAMRDCISRLATLHLVTSASSQSRLQALGYSQVHLVGNPGADYILHESWKTTRPCEQPYVVVSYQAETIDGTVDLDAVKAAIGSRHAIWIKPNLDRGNEAIPATDEFPHDEFLNLLAHCEEFIGNSSAIFYEAPLLGITTTLIGKRQKGRVEPLNDGQASDRIVKLFQEQPCFAHR